MANARIAFEKGSHMAEDMRDGKVLPGYQEMIFDIKMDGYFTRKDRFVAGGHTADPPVSITYSRFVSRDRMGISFMLSSLNDLDVFATKIIYAYFNNPCREKIWTKYGPEFGSQQGFVMLIVRALYGFKSSGASWRAILEENLGKDGLGYTSTDTDKDVWIKR